MKKYVLPSILCGLIVSGLNADIIWDEAVDGDLSNNYLAPDELFVSSGDNIVKFVTVGAEDKEYFTFTIDAGFELSLIILNDFQTDPKGNLAFFGVAEGDVFPTSPDTPSPGDLLGYTLFGSDKIGTDRLQDMGQGGGSIGFEGPLAAGTYTFWAQETFFTDDVWDLNFVIAEVPAPGAIAVLAIGGLGISRRRRK